VLLREVPEGTDDGDDDVQRLVLLLAALALFFIKVMIITLIKNLGTSILTLATVGMNTWAYKKKYNFFIMQSP
jgi:hypothetical protein